MTPSTRPHWSSNGPPRMAAGDVGGVEQGGDAVDRADVGEDADRAGRRQRRDIILGRARGGEIDIAGIAQSARPACRRRAGRCRAGSESGCRRSISSKARSRAGSIATMRARMACAPCEGTTPIATSFPPPAPGDDMGVGDDPVRRDREAAAMAEVRDLLILVELDHHDADDRAAGDGDVVGARRRGEGQQRSAASRKQAARIITPPFLWAAAAAGKRRSSVRRRLSAPAAAPPAARSHTSPM